MTTDRAPSPVDLLKTVDLRPDGPVLWGRPVPASGPGVYLIELPAPLPSAPIEATRVGKWIERVPELRLDGERPTFRTLMARLQAFWLPGQTVLFIGGATSTIGGRIAALRKTPLGDRRPYAGGHWLHTLQGLERARVWWAATDAPEEYEDALLGAFADGVPAEVAAATPQPDLVLPWAVLRRPTGERRTHGITGALLPEAPAAPVPGTTVTDVPPGAADGAGSDAPAPPHPEARRSARPAAERAAAARRTTASKRTARAGSASNGPGGAAGTAAAQKTGPKAAPTTKAPTEVHLSREGLQRLEAELDELRSVRRPEAIRRVATAREHGDLKENAEYHAAREELGFIVGRIHALEDRLRHVVVVEAAESDTAVLGSTVVVEVDGERSVYLLVGSTDSDPAAGRISTSSPVGRALLGHGPGAEVAVATPSGSVITYRVVEVR
jgi:transcription elongation factor GreA